MFRSNFHLGIGIRDFIGEAMDCGTYLQSEVSGLNADFEFVETIIISGTLGCADIVRLSEDMELILNPVNNQKSARLAYAGYLCLNIFNCADVMGRA